MCRTCKLWRNACSSQLQPEILPLFTPDKHRSMAVMFTRLKQCTAFRLKLSLTIRQDKIPLKRSVLRGLCAKLIPAINWDVVSKFRIACSDATSLDMLESSGPSSLWKHVTALGTLDSYNEVLKVVDPGPGIFPHLTKLSIELAMVNLVAAPLERITRLKVFGTRFSVNNNTLGHRLYT